MAHKWLTDKHGIVYHNDQSDVLLRSYMYIVFCAGHEEHLSYVNWDPPSLRDHCHPVTPAHIAQIAATIATPAPGNLLIE